MKPEEFEVYVIPPNFMEGGTLFGGLSFENPQYD